MTPISNLNRRSFIKNTVLVCAGISIIPRHVLGRGFIAPSDQLNIAVIGGGGKGYSDLMNVWNNGASNIAAICDVDWQRSSRAFEQFPKAKKFKDYRKLFDQIKGIDAVTISTPDHTHAVIAMAAMKMGKHIYVQKPLTHDIYEARQLTKAANNYKLVTQMGNQGASGDGVKQMIKWFDEGKIGVVTKVDVWTNRPVWPQGIPVPIDKPNVPEGLDWDTWIGPSKMVDYHPLYHPFKWRGWWNFGTGALGDMGCHLIDPPFRVLGLGYPTEVESNVGAIYTKDWIPEYLPESCPPSSRIQLKFPASIKNKTEVIMTWSDGGLRPFHPELIPADHFIGDDDGANGVMLFGEKGIMTCGTYGKNPKIYFNDGSVLMAEQAPVNTLPENGHQMAWVAACKEGFGKKEHRALTSSFDFSGPLTEAILMGNLAIRSYLIRQEKTPNNFEYPGRKKLLWDGIAMKITNFDEANQFVKRDYREGWYL